MDPNTRAFNPSAEMLKELRALNRKADEAVTKLESIEHQLRSLNASIAAANRGSSYRP